VCQGQDRFGERVEPSVEMVTKRSRITSETGVATGRDGALRIDPTQDMLAPLYS